MTSLAARLGHADDARLLIVNADDFGMSLAANDGITSLLAAGAISGATVMAPCPWAPAAIAAAAANPAWDVGVHLTFTSEWEGYRWGPVTDGRAVASLTDDRGYFHADCASFEQAADEDEVRAELTAQLDRAIALGLAPTHADNHMGSLYGLATGRDFLPLTLEICAAYGLPFRLPRTLEGMGLPAELEAVAAAKAAVADRLGVVIPDRLWTLEFETVEGESYETVRGQMADLLRSLRPGVTEIYIHPFEDTPELRAIMPHWAKRAMELRMFTDPELRAVLESEGITVIGWRDLQELQRDKGAR